MKFFWLSLFIFLFTPSLHLLSQPDNLIGNLYFKLEQLSNNSWGVFVIPDNSVVPSQKSTTGSGQVTIVSLIDFKYYNLKNISGTWAENARVRGPQEAVDKSYISFGFINDVPKINLIPSEETLLFIFSTDEQFNGTFSLFENGKDPFDTPNSFGNNPGNEIGMIDLLEEQGIVYYSYADNYNNEDLPALSNYRDNHPDRAKPNLISKKIVIKGEEE